MPKIIYQPFTISVATSGQTVSKTFSFDNNVKRILSVAVESEFPNLAYYRGSQRLEINNDELLPEGMPTRRLMGNLNIAQDDREFSLGNIEHGNRMLKIDYVDKNHPSAAFVPYDVVFLFKCEM